MIPLSPEIVAVLVSMLGLIFAVLRAGASTVRTNARVAESVETLARSVKKIEDRVESYIANEDRRDDAMEAWRRTVDARLASIEATLTAFTRTGRRRTDR